MSNLTFRKFVIILVTLIGAGFGTWAGLMYMDDLPFWIATLLGLCSSFVLAKLYLYCLDKIPKKGYKKFTVWLMGTITAILCGIVCTTFIHVVMIAALLTQTKYSLALLYEELFFMVIGIAELIGAVVGLIAGGICSLVYVIKIMGKADEAVQSA